MKFTSSNLPIETTYPKLIRDRIPDIIEAKGQKARVETAKDDREFLDYLLKKAVEEAVELQHSHEKDNLEEEVSDLLEIIETILRLQKIDMNDIRAIQQQKREKNGGFEKRLILWEIM